jgi:predicted nuclease of restriction endonuclease-like (RecB) superfamily
MRVFYQAFPIRDALRPELSWIHYRTLLRVESDSARQWFMNEAAGQGWTTRSLERQISTLYYERLLTTSDRTAVEDEAKGNLATLQTPRDFVRDPVMLEFLGLPGVGKLLEADFEKALLDNLQAFLLELGRGFAAAFPRRNEVMFAVDGFDLACSGVETGFVICAVVSHVENSEKHLHMRIARCLLK